MTNGQFIFNFFYDYCPLTLLWPVNKLANDAVAEDVHGGWPMRLLTEQTKNRMEKLLWHLHDCTQGNVDQEVADKYPHLIKEADDLVNVIAQELGEAFHINNRFFYDWKKDEQMKRPAKQADFGFLPTDNSHSSAYTGETRHD